MHRMRNKDLAKKIILRAKRAERKIPISSKRFAEMCTETKDRLIGARVDLHSLEEVLDGCLSPLQIGLVRIAVRAVVCHGGRVNKLLRAESNGLDVVNMFLSPFLSRAPEPTNELEHKTFARNWLDKRIGRNSRTHLDPDGNSHSPEFAGLVTLVRSLLLQRLHLKRESSRVVHDATLSTRSTSKEKANQNCPSDDDDDEDKDAEQEGDAGDESDQDMEDARSAIPGYDGAHPAELFEPELWQSRNADVCFWRLREVERSLGLVMYEEQDNVDADANVDAESDKSASESLCIRYLRVVSTLYPMTWLGRLDPEIVATQHMLRLIVHLRHAEERYEDPGRAFDQILRKPRTRLADKFDPPKLRIRPIGDGNYAKIKEHVRIDGSARWSVAVKTPLPYDDLEEGTWQIEQLQYERRAMAITSSLVYSGSCVHFPILHYHFPHRFWIGEISVEPKSASRHRKIRMIEDMHDRHELLETTASVMELSNGDLKSMMRRLYVLEPVELEDTNTETIAGADPFQWIDSMTQASCQPDPPVMLSVVAQVIYAIFTLHKTGISHNDLYARNILVETIRPVEFEYVVPESPPRADSDPDKEPIAPKDTRIVIPSFGVLAKVADFGLCTGESIGRLYSDLNRTHDGLDALCPQHDHVLFFDEKTLPDGYRDLCSFYSDLVERKSRIGYTFTKHLRLHLRGLKDPDPAYRLQRFHELITTHLLWIKQSIREQISSG